MDLHTNVQTRTHNGKCLSYKIQHHSWSKDQIYQQLSVIAVSVIKWILEVQQGKVLTNNHAKSLFTCFTQTLMTSDCVIMHYAADLRFQTTPAQVHDVCTRVSTCCCCSQCFISITGCSKATVWRKSWRSCRRISLHLHRSKWRCTQNAHLTHA